MHIGTMRNSMSTCAQYGIVGVPITIFFQCGIMWPTSGCIGYTYTVYSNPTVFWNSPVDKNNLVDKHSDLRWLHSVENPMHIFWILPDKNDLIRRPHVGSIPNTYRHIIKKQLMLYIFKSFQVLCKRNQFGLCFQFSSKDAWSHVDEVGFLKKLTFK
jgi:hypothetical protein